MKFSEIARGTRGDEDIELPRFNGQPEEMSPLKARVRALNGIEEEQALSAARRRAKAQGVEDPKPGEPLFDLALMVETIAIAYLDGESPANARTPFFDGGGDDVRGAFGREAIVLMYETQQEYQDRVAPTLAKLSPFDFYNGILKLGDEDEQEARFFYLHCRAGLRWSFTRSMAVQQRSVLMSKFSPGSPSETDSNQSESNANNQAPAQN